MRNTFLRTEAIMRTFVSVRLVYFCTTSTMLTICTICTTALGVIAFASTAPLLYAQQAIPIPQQTPLTGAQADSVAAKNLRDLRAEITALTSDSVLGSASLGLYIASLKSKDVIISRNDTKAMVPASNMKIASTAAAMDYLGADFTYTTTVFLDGILKKSSGEFVGNVIVRGAGDPSISDYFYEDPTVIFRRWCETLDSLGVRSIRGNIVGDDTYFDDEPWGAGWCWDDIPFYYSAQISAFSFNDNTVAITVKPAFSVGQPAELTLTPPTTYVTLVNNVKTVPVTSSASVSITRQAYSNVIYVNGTIAADTTYDTARDAARDGSNIIPQDNNKRTLIATVDNPTLYFLSLFKKTLGEHGITVRGSIFDSKQWGDKIAYTELRPVCYHTSPPLKDIMRNINTVSNNLGAEMIFRTAAKEATGKGNADNAADVIRNFAEKNGVSMKGAAVADGSGLSRFNLVSARQMAGFLTVMYNSRNRTAFMRSLAVPGERGTLSSRFKNTIVEKNLKAKTGTLTNISALSGYVTTRDQEPIVFSMIFNNYTVPASAIRAIQEAVCLRLANFSRK
jgi:serine-type D-Ala-D-Ala carboxypeptidase/endopeptidase (penicillin-binding protein 4)